MSSSSSRKSSKAVQEKRVKKSQIAEIIYKTRRARHLTQDEFGDIYEVSGPAIFKFEKGYVRPSLELWLKIARDAELTERWATLLWLQQMLPTKYRQYVELRWAGSDDEMPWTRDGRTERRNYAACKERDELLKLAQEDPNMPRGLRELLQDDELWAIYKPTGDEVNYLVQNFAALGRGSKNLYREAIYVLRLFRPAPDA